MSRVLIYMPENKLKPIGGQAGYLYNLKQGLDKMNTGDISISFYNNSPVRFEDNASLKKRIPRRILELRRALNDALFLRKKFDPDYSMNEYDMIHFHWTEEMYLNREFLEQYPGKVILTSHSPCVMYKEKIEKLNPLDYKILKPWIDKLEKMDQYAFERADYIIFPCEEAEEPYFHTWEKYSSIRVASKCRYMPTGIVGCTAKVGREEFRKKYNIPEDAFVVSYAGRHNEIKGYKELKELGEKLINNYDNVYFLIAGKEEPIGGLDHERWIEVGWTNDPHSLVAASDVFVLPNRETYFDLILLEVISLGVPVVMSRTGGNKYFSRFNSEGLMLYDSQAEAVEHLLSLKDETVEERRNIGALNFQLFSTEFTVDKFARRYVDVLKNL